MIAAAVPAGGQEVPGGWLTVRLAVRRMTPPALGPSDLRSDQARTGASAPARIRHRLEQQLPTKPRNELRRRDRNLADQFADQKMEPSGEWMCKLPSSPSVKAAPPCPEVFEAQTGWEPGA